MPSIEEFLDRADPGTSWILDPRRTEVTFRNRTLWGMASVTGTFADVRGSGTIFGGHSVTGHIGIDPASVRTGIAKRDEHLRSDDFFDVARFPTIAVEVHGSTVTWPATFELHATLVVKGVELAIDLPTRVSLLDDGAVFVVTRAEIDRRDVGVDGNLLGMVGHTTRLVAEAVFTPQTGDSS